MFLRCIGNFVPSNVPYHVNTLYCNFIILFDWLNDFNCTFTFFPCISYVSQHISSCCWRRYRRHCFILLFTPIVWRWCHSRSIRTGDLVWSHCNNHYRWTTVRKWRFSSTSKKRLCARNRTGFWLVERLFF